MTTSASVSTPPQLEVIDLGRMDYAACLQLQRDRVDARAAGTVGDALLLVEHPPTITLGRRRDSAQNILFPGDWPVVEVERGGDVTWHGPGQLVGYPIIALTPGERDLHRVLRHLEDAMIAVLRQLSLPGERKPGHTGVWCHGKKLVSLGVAVRRWVTYHGFALNVDPDLTAFQRINPCGLGSGVMGSITSVGGVVPAPASLKTLVSAAIAVAFDRQLVSLPQGSPA